MDLFEANRHAIQITPHQCTGGTSGCDAGGCAKNTQSLGTTAFGPATTYTINSLQTFTVKISFAASGGTLTGITSVISQGAKSITLTHGSECGSTYLATVGTAISAGMVPTFSVWSGSMSWLDSPACSSDTPEVSGNVIFSNIIVTGATGSTTGPPPPPPPPPVAPVPAGTQICGTTGCTTNTYWVEFKAPSGVDGASTTATVTCGTTSYTCSWFSSGSKYQCSATGGCSSPVAYVGGKPCSLNSNYALSDASVTSVNESSDQPLILGLSVGLGVAILIIVVLIIAFMIKMKSVNYVETA